MKISIKKYAGTFLKTFVSAVLIIAMVSQNLVIGNAGVALANGGETVNFFGRANGLTTTPDVDLSKDTGANVGTVLVKTKGTKHIYVHDMYQTNYYFETKIHVNEVFNNDGYPKFGLFAESGTVRENFYVDMTPNRTATEVGRMTSSLGENGWIDNWNKNDIDTVTVENMNFAGAGEYVTLGLSKENGTFLFSVNGTVVLTYQSTLIGDTTMGVFGFNTGMEIKEYFVNGISSMLRINNEATLETAEIDATVWTDKPYVFTSLPKELIGTQYVKGAYGNSTKESNELDVTVLRAGYLYVLTKEYKTNNSQAEKLDDAGYTKLDIPGWKFCNFSSNEVYVWAYEKYVEAGETLQLGTWSVVFASDKKLNLTDNGYTVSDSEMAVLKPTSDGATVNVMELLEKAFADKSYEFTDMPYWMAGKNYIMGNYGKGTAEVTRGGVIYMVTNNGNDGKRENALQADGFEKVDVPTFTPFTGGNFDNYGFVLYKKTVNVGDTVSWPSWAIPIFSGDFIPSETLAKLQPDTTTTQVCKMERGARLFKDRNYNEMGGTPASLMGKSFLYSNFEVGGSATVTEAGTVYIQIPTKDKSIVYSELATQITGAGFTEAPYRVFRNNKGIGYSQRIYQKEVSVGEEIHFGKYNLVFFGALGNKEDYYVIPSISLGAKVYNNPLENPLAPTNERCTYKPADRNWQGCPVITITDGPTGKRLWAGWFTGGKDELGKGNLAVLLYSDDDGQTWIDPAVAFVHPDESVKVTKPQVWTMDDGRLWVSWTQDMATGTFDGKMGTWAAICENPDAENPDDFMWSEPKRLFDGRGNGKITVIEKEDGSKEWLTTAFDWIDRDYSKVYSSVDNGQTWTFKGKAFVTGSEFNNAVMVERKDESGGTYLWMLLRQLSGNMKESFSYDGGVTWTNGKVSAIAHPNSAIYLSRTESGKLLMINHKDFSGRNNLTAFLSEDEGVTWKTLLLDERSGVSYPDVVEDSDGMFYIVYDYDRFKTGQMYMATVTEEDIIAGEFKSPGAKRKMRFSSMGLVDAQVDDTLKKLELSNKYTWSSTTGNNAGSANAAFDGKENTRWCAVDGSFPQTLSVDLGESKDISNVNVSFEQAGQWQYTIRASEDGISWTDCATNPNEVPRQKDYQHGMTLKARYVSIEITAGGTNENGSNCWASIWEMSVLDAEGTNLAQDKPCKATSVSPNSNSVEKAFDGNQESRFCASSNTKPQQLMIDLEDIYDIGAVYMFFEQKSIWNYTLETSLDGESWDEYVKPGDKSLLCVTETKNAMSRYVRLTVNDATPTGRYKEVWASLYEMEIYVRESSDITLDEAGAKIQFRGGSLRMDYTDYAKTSLRFGYKIYLPEGATLKNWSWTYTTINPDRYFTGNGIKKTVNADGSINANLVITGIPSAYYDLVLTAKMKIEYILADGTVHTLEEPLARTRSVDIVARKISSNQEATQAEQDYARLILQQ